MRQGRDGSQKRVYYQADYHLGNWRLIPLGNSAASLPQALGLYSPTPPSQQFRAALVGSPGTSGCCTGQKSQILQLEVEPLGNKM